MNTATQMTGDVPGMITWAAANERYSADGKFNKWNFSSVKMKGKDVTTLNATVNIDLTSIWEKSDKLVEHLKAWDYFDVAKYQNAQLVISNVRKGRGGMHVADMELQMRDKVQKMESQFKVTSTKPLRVVGTANVDRSIFGIGVDNTSVPNMIEVKYDTVIPN